MKLRSHKLVVFSIAIFSLISCQQIKAASLASTEASSQQILSLEALQEYISAEDKKESWKVFTEAELIKIHSIQKQTRSFTCAANQTARICALRNIEKTMTKPLLNCHYALKDLPMNFALALHVRNYVNILKVFQSLYSIP